MVKEYIWQQEKWVTWLCNNKFNAINAMVKENVVMIVVRYVKNVEDKKLLQKLKQ